MTAQNTVVTVDVVLITALAERLHVVLTRRPREPFAGALALPGGYIDPKLDREARTAAERVLLAKTGLVSPYLEQLYTFADGARDPRGWSVSVSYFALLPHARIADQAASAFELLPVADLPRLAFDHNRIVATAVERLRVKGAYSSLPAYLLGETFTLRELQTAYEIATGEPLHKAAFRRRLAELDFVEATGEVSGGAHRPAQLYRLKEDRRLAVFEKTV